MLFRSPMPQNEMLRVFLTRGALSDECANLPDTCNVCSSRMSPFPHLHTPGNMWLARCSYIQQLVKPSEFLHLMGLRDNSCTGGGRNAAEHWVHAHPNNRPCDLYKEKSYTWFIWGIPKLRKFEASIELAMAPRFEPQAYVKRTCRKKRPYHDGNLLVDEFQQNYNITPSSDWWGWDWFNLTVPKDKAVI